MKEKEKLTFNDLDSIYMKLIDVEKVVHEIYKKLIDSRNYKDLEIIAKLKLKLDDIEFFVENEANKKRGNSMKKTVKFKALADRPMLGNIKKGEVMTLTLEGDSLIALYNEQTKGLIEIIEEVEEDN